MHVRTKTTFLPCSPWKSKTSTIHMNNSVKRGLHGHKRRLRAVACDAHNHIHLSKDGGIPRLSKDEMIMMMVLVLVHHRSALYISNPCSCCLIATCTAKCPMVASASASALVLVVWGASSPGSVGITNALPLFFSCIGPVR